MFFKLNLKKFIIGFESGKVINQKPLLQHIIGNLNI